MQWLRDRGICSSLAERDELDERVLADCRLLMEAEALRRAKVASGG